MKKCSSLLLLSVLLVSCNTQDPSLSMGETTTSSSSEDLKTSSTNFDDLIFISEVYKSSTYGFAVEIANCNDSIVDLSNYKLNIKKSSGKLVKEVSLSGVALDKNETYVIANKSNDETFYHSLCDYILDDDYLTGYNVLDIVNENDEVIDTLGGNGLNYCYYGSYLKLPSKYHATNQFDNLNYFGVKVSSEKNYLGNLDFVFEDETEILNGPKLSSRYYYDSSFSNGTTPGGGILNVSIVSHADGDTTSFRISSPPNGIENVERTRYMLINTPEIDHGPNGVAAQPWGETAKSYTVNKLNAAKHIIIQSVKGYGFRETYGRLLAFVWYTNNSDATVLEDYHLLNFEIVRDSLAWLGLSDDGLKELYDDNSVYYESYCSYAYNRAVKLGNKIHGEEDPSFNK